MSIRYSRTGRIKDLHNILKKILNFNTFYTRKKLHDKKNYEEKHNGYKRASYSNYYIYNVKKGI